jgi:DNA-binding IclR family transcriptional regulator
MTNPKQNRRSKAGEKEVREAYGLKFLLALDILALFRPGVRPLTLREISQMSGARDAAVERAVFRLISLGYLQAFPNSQRYWPTTRLYWIREWHASTAVPEDLPAPMSPRILAQAFAGRRQAMVAVGVADGDRFNQIAYWSARQNEKSPAILNAAEIFATPQGLAWLWAQPAAESTASVPLAHLTTAAKVFEQLNAQGYCLLQYPENQLVFAAPIIRANKPVASIACAAESSPELPELLRRVAAVVAASMFP